MKWKVVIGVLLIALSIGGMYYWESYGRDRVMLTPVLTVAADIPEGSLIRAEDLAEMRVPGEDVISGALTLADAGSVVGKYASLVLGVKTFIVGFHQGAPDLFREGRISAIYFQIVFDAVALHPHIGPLYIVARIPGQ